MSSFKDKDWYGAEKNIVLAIILAILFVSVALSCIQYVLINSAMVEDIRDRARVVNEYVGSSLLPEGFTEINNPQDAGKSVYRDTQDTLNDIRQIANIRYLYSTKFDENGSPVYLVDGLPPDSPDFRHPGDLIEKDIVPMLTRCLSGEEIESDGILNTDWGAIFLTCMPIRHIQEKPLGAVVMEFNADVLYANKQRAMLYSGLLALVVVVGCILITLFCLRRLATPFYKKLAYTDMLTGIGNRTAFELKLRELEAPSVRGITLVSYDLNLLKHTNDTFGHAAGDAYLRHMAQLLVHEEPPRRGLSFRIGGDEFVTLFENADMDILCKEMERFHLESARGGTGKKAVTFAYGIASYDQEQDKGKLHNTLSRADALMYRFKKATRCAHD